MEHQYIHNESGTDNGQAVYSEDLNLLGENSALADDRTLAELIRMLPYGSAASRGIMPFRTDGMMSASDPLLPGQCIVQGGTGKVIIKPFRAFIGSRAAAGAGVVDENWRDIRSALLLGASALDTEVTFDSTGAAEHRNDLVYALVTVDKDAAAVNRKVKDPTTGQITTESVVTEHYTEVTVAVLKDTAKDGSIPATPSDSGSNYYIPIAVVHLPNSWTSGSTLIPSTNIYELAPPVALSESTGASVVRPANGSWTQAGAVNTNYPWAFTNRKPGFLPPTMIGGEEVIVALDLTTAVSPHFSHVTGDVIDDSRDWTKRIWTWQACAISGTSTPSFPWESGSSTPFVPASTCTGSGLDAQGWGQSFYDASGKAMIAQLTPTELTGMAGGSTIDIYVDTTTGDLKIDYAGSPNIKGFLWLRASAQYGNAR